MAANRRTAIAIAVAGVLLVVASATQAFREIVPYLASGVGDRQRFDAIASGVFEPASSNWSRDLYLNDCLDVTESLFARAQSAQMRRRAMENCRSNALRVVATTPNASNGWLVLATMSAELEDYQTMRSALAMSRQTAPNLRWLAYRRSRLVEKHASEVDSAGFADYDNDIAVLASGEQGTAELARRYAKKPQFRDRYARVVDTLSPERKRAFLGKVKVEMSR